jgi:hypothetical protein
VANSKISFEILKIAKRLVAIDFPNQQAMDKYLKEHPKANKSNHKVVQNKQPNSQIVTPTTQVRPVEENQLRPQLEAKLLTQDYVVSVLQNVGWDEDDEKEINFGKDSEDLADNLIKGGINKKYARQIVYHCSEQIEAFNHVKPIQAIGMVLALHNYVGNGYRAMNNFLYGKNHDVETKESLEWLDGTFSNAPSEMMDDHDKVYRGVPMRLNDWKKIKVGAVVNNPAFLSTTPDMKVASQFSDYSWTHGDEKPEGRRKAVVFVIKKTKQFGLNLSNIGDHTDESEVLLPRNTKFKIDSIQDSGDEPFAKINVTVVP